MNRMKRNEWMLKLSSPGTASWLRDRRGSCPGATPRWIQLQTLIQPHQALLVEGPANLCFAGLVGMTIQVFLVESQKYLQKNVCIHIIYECMYACIYLLSMYVIHIIYVKYLYMCVFIYDMYVCLFLVSTFFCCSKFERLFFTLPPEERQGGRKAPDASPSWMAAPGCCEPSRNERNLHMP